MTKLIKLLTTIVSMPIFIIVYMFFCVIIISKIILKTYRKIINSFCRTVDNYLKD